MRRGACVSANVPRMNFLAHLFLAGDDEGLRLGALLGDFVHGHVDKPTVPAVARRGILLHRWIDHYIDSRPEVALLRERFEPPFRRYGGIIVDLAFDHQLALHWNRYADVTLEQFDRDVRDLLARHQASLPEDLLAFMRYADRRGLFAAYRDEAEILHSLRGLGRRLSRPNPLSRVGEIWADLQPALSQTFRLVFPQVQRAVTEWLRQTDQRLPAGQLDPPGHDGK
jgi:acyl carrier protein phosphodiesterase